MCGRAYTSVSKHTRVASEKKLFALTLTRIHLRLLQETYLMKHMSKHTVVEHLVTHQSPQRTESPSIPIRISLI